MAGKMYEFKDKDGSISLRRVDDILHVNISGLCGIDLVNFYSNSISKIAPQFGGTKWGLVSNSPGYQAATPDAEKVFYDVALICIEAGCRADAYVMQSPIAIAQTNAIRKSYGAPVPFEQVLFVNETDAVNYLTQALKKYKVKSN
jgi:hypothetical protein